ncbi:MAG: hypothetical protein JXR94_19115 [Candidatus Hydrogenedentes bacterium]|nr:hypothetical protein [Candidatus Hydrogenedentota bacterium]
MGREDGAIQFNIAYHPTPYPHAMRRDLEEIAEVCDGIYLVFAESDLEYGSNKVKHCIDLAHEQNLIVLADFWGYGNLFACGAIPSLFTVQHPEYNCVTNRGRTIPKSCPNKQGVRDFMRGAVEGFMATYGADGVFWDEPSYGLAGYLGRYEDGEWACRCDDCQAKFRDRYGKEMPAGLTAEVEEFRNETMLGFLSDLCAYTKGCGEHLVTSTCIMTSDSEAFREAVAQTPQLDVFGIDPYWRPDQDVSQKDFIERYTGDSVAMGKRHGKLVEAWVCAWKQNAGHEADAYRAAKLNAQHDIDCLSAWSYRDYISWDPCDRANAADPERVWKNLKRAYSEIRDDDLEIRE